MFSFVIKYQTGHSNRATNALSQHPFSPSCDIKSESETDSDKVEVISYFSVCEVVDHCFNSTKIPEDLKQEAQIIRCAVPPIIEEKNKGELVSTLNVVSIFEQVTPEEMAEKQQKDLTLELVYQ